MLKICTCWDDGVLNDIRLTELFRKYDAKATFNLNPGLHKKQRFVSNWTYKTELNGKQVEFHSGKLALGEIKDVYEGFEVASHGWTHKGAHKTPPEEMVTEAMDARKFLEDIFQREFRGYAWPSGQTTKETADLLGEAGFAYGRTTANMDDVSNYEHPMLLASSCHFRNPDFLAIMDKARETSGYFYFWGHSYEMMDAAKLWNAFEDKLRIIAENPDNEWIDVIDLVRIKSSG